MKKIIAVIVVLIIALTLCIAPQAYGDVLSLSQIASAAYAYGQAAGINFGFTGGTSTGALTWMENRINNWLAGRTIIEAFGSEVFRVSAGKLVIPASLALNIASFLRDLIMDEGITIDNPIEVLPGVYDGIPLSNNMTSFVYETPIQGIGMYRKSPLSAIWPEIGASSGSYGASFLYKNNSMLHQFGNSGKYFSFHFWNLTQVGNNIRCNYVTSTSNTVDGDRVYNTQYYDFTPTGDITDKLVISLDENYGYPEFPDVGYNWEGDIGAASDTNLDQLLGNIIDDVADNNLEITGEVVEDIQPGPEPTPIPVDPDIPLQDVPWGGLNDLIGQTENSITSSQDATTEAVESLTNTITGALDVPDSEELPDFKFDLRELFPFCIPFDIYRLLSSFDAEPQAPHVQLPIVIGSIGFSYNLDLDFKVWDPVAQAMRTAELIVYAIGLAWATGKVIKW